MDEVSVRDAAAEDVAAIRKVAREAWHAAYDDIVGSEAVESVVNDWYDADGVEQSVERDDGRFLVAESDGNVVGFAQAVLGDEAAEIPRLYVHPDRWDEGIGSELLGRIESWLDERERERVRLIVLADNEVGNAFYERHDYRTVGSRESEIRGETYTDYVREKEL